MNIDEARERLLDLVYGELDEPARAEVLRAVEASPELRRELADLRAARAAIAQTRVGEPEHRIADILVAAATVSPAESEPTQKSEGRMPALRAGGTPAIRRTPVTRASARRRSLRIIGWLSPLAAAACILVIILPAMLRGPHAPEVGAAPGPVEIKRTDVSLTILSEPEDSGGPQPLYGRLRAGWQGLALVRDQRAVRNLPKGATEVKVTEVPADIIPESVRLRSLDDPTGISVLEQNYQYDLASADKILHRYIDKPIHVVDAEGKMDARDLTLLSYSDSDLVVEDFGPPNRRIVNPQPVTISREKLKAIRFGELPEGLLTRPTLVWTLRNQAAANQRLEVAYMTKGLFWRADYVLRITPGKKTVDTPAKPLAASQEGSRTPTGDRNPEVIDTAELVGYATVTNVSGVAYPSAQLKLLAGDVHLVQEDRRNMEQIGGVLREAGKAEDKGGAFEEKSFFEYHLYTLGRPTSLANDETKQIELATAGGIQLKRAYVYDRTVNPTAARVVSEFKNSEKDGSGLGRPLPKGVIRLYAPDPEGTDAYVAETKIDHTPKDEKVRLPWGFAFDIACSARQTANQVNGRAGSQKWLYTIRSAKDYDVTVTVVVRVPKSTTRAECTRPGAGATAATAGAGGEKHPWHVREVGIVEIDVPVKAGATAAAEFSFDYDNDRGGELKSPYDR